MVTEFLNKGSALQLLQSSEKKLIFQPDLMGMALDCAAGMSYLHSQHILHCDLSLRNLLVTNVANDPRKKYILKVGDFGLSKVLTNQTYYSKSQKVLPIKWSSPELIEYGKFSQACDVWSFGVVVWEIFSFGKSPYAAFSNNETIEQIANGFRLPKPELCPDELYEIVQRCWNMDPDHRPSFVSIAKQLERMWLDCFPDPQTLEASTDVSSSALRVYANAEFYSQSPSTYETTSANIDHEATKIDMNVYDNK